MPGGGGILFIEELAMPTEIRYILNTKGRKAAGQDEKG